jgi:hypothetical protein
MVFEMNAFAGPGASGGGQAFVCRNSDGTVASAKLLDLVEAEDYFLLQLPTQPQDRPYLEIAHEYAAILDGSIASSYPPLWKEVQTVGNGSQQLDYEVNMLATPKSVLEGTVDRIDATKMFIPGNDFQIPPVGDSHPLVLPSEKGCSIEQVALYSDNSEQVHFVESVWSKLDNLNKAALLIHESLYRDLRGFGDTSSDRTRRAVAYLFGGLKFDWILAGVPEQYLVCWTTDASVSFQFVVYPKGDHEVTAQFLVYNGQNSLTKTTTDLPDAQFASAFGSPAPLTSTILKTDEISNPLLEMPKYTFMTAYNSKKVIVSTIEAFSSAFLSWEPFANRLKLQVLGKTFGPTLFQHTQFFEVKK